MKRTNKKGFTLVELVVVIAVLLILAAIAIPTVSGVIARAHKSADEANAKAIETAIKYQIAQNEIENDKTKNKIGDALATSGMSTDILVCEQDGMAFAYDEETNTITIVENVTALSENINIYTGD